MRILTVAQRAEGSCQSVWGEGIRTAKRALPEGSLALNPPAGTAQNGGM